MPSTICCRVLLSFFIVLLFFTLHQPELSHANGSMLEGKKGTAAKEDGMVPLIEEGKEMVLMVNETRRKLGGFQICALCTCCSSNSAKGGYCLPTPCCYAITCNIPNRPFGFCSFLPKTCNCFGCHL